MSADVKAQIISQNDLDGFLKNPLIQTKTTDSHKGEKYWIVFIIHSDLFFSDSFVNSQEWTLSRGVPDIRLGIVGSLSSGKSALVHRYLTGTSLASPQYL